jgi:putative tricarboxylic transport membrane protein
MPAGVIFYLLVIDWLGFLLTAAIMIALLSIALGATRKASLVNAILGALLAYGFFAELLRVPLATGNWLNYFRGF